MTQKELDIVLKKHKAWLSNEPDGERANLREADLRWTDLRGTDLSVADLRWADLRGTDLSGTNLRWADLRGTNLRGTNLHGTDLSVADLQGVDLRGADLDFSCWPLWCGSLGVVVDRRIAAQIAYHFCRLVCDDPGYIKARNAILDFANGFHRVNECGYLEPIEGKEGS